MSTRVLRDVIRLFKRRLRQRDGRSIPVRRTNCRLIGTRSGGNQFSLSIPVKCLETSAESMMRILGCFVAVALTFLTLGAERASAVLQVNINQGNIQPLPIAIPDFAPGQPADAAVAQQIAGVIRADLD